MDLWHIKHSWFMYKKLICFCCRYLTDQLMKIQVVNDVNKVTTLNYPSSMFFHSPFKCIQHQYVYFNVSNDLALLYIVIGFCDRGTEINCRVDNIWRPAWCKFLWVRFFFFYFYIFTLLFILNKTFVNEVYLSGFLWRNKSWGNLYGY